MSTPLPSPQPAEALARQVLPPAHRSPTVYLLIASTALSVVGFAAMLALLLGAAEAGDADTAVVELSFGAPPRSPSPPTPAATLAALPPTSPPAAAAAPVSHGDFAFVIELAGAAYLIIGDALGEGAQSFEDKLAALPPHHAIEIFGERPNPHALLATVEPATLAPAMAGWLGEPVVLDTGCVATVDGFSLLSTLTGSSDFTGAALGEDSSDAELSRYLLEYGTTVLVARLTGCTTGAFGRHQPEGPLLIAERLDHPGLQAAARTRFGIDSDAEGEIQRRFEAEQGGTTRWWDDAIDTVETMVLRHPVTGATLVTAQVLDDYGCGGLEVNLWAVYGVGADGGLSPLREASDAESVVEITAAVDTDGDGELEFVANTLFGSRLLIDRAGRIRQSFKVPFYDCPC